MRFWLSSGIAVLIHIIILMIPIKMAVEKKYEPVKLIITGGGKTPQLTAAPRGPTPLPKKALVSPKKPRVKKKKAKQFIKPRKKLRPIKVSQPKPVAPRLPRFQPQPVAVASSYKREVTSRSPGSMASGRGWRGGTGISGSQSHGPIDTSFGAVHGPRFIKKAIPRYPMMARRLKKAGKVLLRITLNERGQPIKVVVVRGAGFGFDKAAREAVQRSIYRPASRNGKPVACRALLTIEFKRYCE